MKLDPEETKKLVALHFAMSAAEAKLAKVRARLHEERLKVLKKHEAFGLQFSADYTELLNGDSPARTE